MFKMRQTESGRAKILPVLRAPLAAPAGREFPDRRTPGKKVKKQSFRMKPVYWILIAEIALAAVGIFFGIRLLGERFSARRVVEVYAQALEERDWGTAYDCLNMEGETAFPGKNI